MDSRSYSSLIRLDQKGNTICINEGIASGVSILMDLSVSEE